MPLPWNKGWCLRGEFMKNRMEIQWNVQNYKKLMFSNDPSPQGVWGQFTKYFLLEEICMKCVELHRNVIYCTPYPWGKVLVHITEHRFWWKLHEIYRTIQNLMFTNSYITTKGWGIRIEFTKLCNIKQKNFSELFPPPLYQVEVAKYDFCVQIWTFHSILSKNNYGGNQPPSQHHSNEDGSMQTCYLCADLDIAFNF